MAARGSGRMVSSQRLRTPGPRKCDSTAGQGCIVATCVKEETPMRRIAWLGAILGSLLGLAADAALPATAAAEAKASFLIIGNDEKVTFDDTGKTVFGAP